MKGARRQGTPSCPTAVLAGFAVTAVACIAEPAAVTPAWDFDSQNILQTWVPNADLTDIGFAEGILRARAVGPDPFLLCRDLALAANPWQYVLVRVRATEGGIAELFWSGELTGQYGGLTELKKVRFELPSDRQWHEIAVFPFWHAEGTIRQLRLDLYDGASFELDWLRVAEWGKGLSPAAVYVWDFKEDVSAWRVHPQARELFAPPVRLDVADKGWVTATLRSETEETAGILWACEGVRGLQSEEFVLHGDGQWHTYNVRLSANPQWKGTVVAFGIRLPAGNTAQVQHIQITNQPSGPPDVEVTYFGFEDGVNRAGKRCRVLAQMINRGVEPCSLDAIRLELPQGVGLADQPASPTTRDLQHGQIIRFAWNVEADKPGTYEAKLVCRGNGTPEPRTAALTFTPPPQAGQSDYVPPPKPVRAEVDVCAYYFPGWEAPRKWDCVRDTTPWRKPLLGYYDESNPQCVDWQIKWALENGISCFLVDWYWVAGQQQLTHWFDAYRKARYRDMLKVAIMWANHNPPNTHSVKDWHDVTRHWVDRYFTLPAYYRIDGKPVVILWNPDGLRSDLGGSDVVARMLGDSQDMARKAGFPGIHFVAMGHSFTRNHVEALIKEGFAGITTYHEWGRRITGTDVAKQPDFRMVVEDSDSAWLQKNKTAQGLAYYPVVDTGWDSRPWHGNKAMVIRGRTAPLFEELLRKARTFCRTNGKPILILGPVNEWGEGSYIEPCTEFGFAMLEAVRRTLATSPAESWPVNLAPSDVGLGPYDYPQTP